MLAGLFYLSPTFKYIFTVFKGQNIYIYQPNRLEVHVCIILSKYLGKNDNKNSFYFTMDH